jgi:CRP/FNR family transcriptional regulator
MMDARSAFNPAQAQLSKRDTHNVPNFCDLSASAMSCLEKVSVECRLPARATIFEQEGLTSSIFLICKGRVRVYSTASSGRIMISRIAVRGDMLGLSAMLNQEPNEATAETVEAATVKSISCAAFERLLKVSNEISAMTVHVLARENHGTFIEARRLALSLSISGRLSDLLLNYAHYAPSSVPPITFRMKFTHEELGNMLGTSRETVTRLLNRYERDGFIARCGSTVRILKPARLASLASR